MMGPWTYAAHLMSGPRLPFTAAYFGSIALTLYFSLGASDFTIIYQTVADSIIAWKHIFDVDLVINTAGVLTLVPCQLLPNG